jgi:hypothetical protein
LPCRRRFRPEIVWFSAFLPILLLLLLLLLVVVLVLVLVIVIDWRTVRLYQPAQKTAEDDDDDDDEEDSENGARTTLGMPGYPRTPGGEIALALRNHRR